MTYCGFEHVMCLHRPRFLENTAVVPAAMMPSHT